MAKVRKLVKPHLDWLDVKVFQVKSPIAGSLVPLLQEAITYIGIMNPSPFRLHQEAQRKFEIYSDCKKEILLFLKKIKGDK